MLTILIKKSTPILVGTSGEGDAPLQFNWAMSLRMPPPGRHTDGARSDDGGLPRWHIWFAPDIAHVRSRKEARPPSRGFRTVRFAPVSRDTAAGTAIPQYQIRLVKRHIAGILPLGG